MTRKKMLLAVAMISVPLAALSAPAPDRLRLVAAGTVKIVKLAANDATLIDENRVAIVGWQGDPKDIFNLPGPDEGQPSGAIINLEKKTAEAFSDRHDSQIWSVSSQGGRLVSGSAGTGKALLRSWDLKAQEGGEVLKLDRAPSSYQLRCFHRSGRVVVDGTERLIVLDPAKRRERMELACPPSVEFLSSPLAVSPDDAWIACTGSENDQVVCFELATKKATVVQVSPEGGGEKWSVASLKFAPSGKSLFVCRFSAKADEVPKGKDERDVPTERRGIVRIDLPEGKVVPLNMGHTCGPCDCAVDGSATWLATVGRSHSEKEVAGVGELRVYNLSSGKLAYREQLKDGVPGWVWFTPSGKRIVCATNDGTVRWWDVPVR